MPDVVAVAQFVGQALHIVVIREVIEPGIVAEALQTPHGMGDFEIVVVVVAAPQTLMQFVVGDRVEHLGVGPAAVVAMDDLAHQPELRLHLVGNAAQAPHEVEVQHVGSVQTDAVNIELIHPEADGVEVVVLHLGVALVQLDQQVEAAPVAVREAVVVLVVAPEIHVAEPVAVAGVLTVLLQLLEREEIAAHMVEHAVHDDLLAPLMAGGDKLLEFLIGAETPVYQPVVDGVIAVGTALEQRADIDRRTAKLCRVFCPRIQLFESPGDRLSVVFMRAAAQSQRIDVIEYRIVMPSHCLYRSCFQKVTAEHFSDKSASVSYSV
jgi:hypothetical protein